MVFALWRAGHFAISASAGGDLWDDAFQFDGQNYRKIFLTGYELPVPDAFQRVTSFFPLTGWLARIPAVVFDDRVSMLLVANVMALGAFVGFHASARRWYGTVTARWTMLVVALFPSSFFLWAFYSEATFVSLSALGLWAAAREKRTLAGLCAFGVAMTRPPGVLFGGSLAAVRLFRRRSVDATTVFYAASAAIGMGVVMMAQWIEADDPLDFLDAPADWDRRLSGPWVALSDGLGPLRTSGLSAATFRLGDLVVLILAGLVILAIMFEPSCRIQPEAMVFGVALAAVPLFSGLLGGYARYAFSAWPLIVIGSRLVHRAPRLLRAGLIGLLALLCVLLSRDWADGVFAG